MRIDYIASGTCSNFFHRLTRGDGIDRTSFNLVLMITFSPPVILSIPCSPHLLGGIGLLVIFRSVLAVLC